METRNCQNCKQDFLIDEEDFNFYKMVNVPAPTFCPECRMIRRFNFRNERYLFRRPDAFTGKEIFSGFSPESPVKTIENSVWFSTDWDALETGRGYDFSRSFFEQFRELLSVAPLPARSVYNILNSDYSNEASELKNSYLSFNADFLENCSYIKHSNHIKESLDLFECSDDELCYEDVMVDKSYNTHFSLDCESCVDVWFSRGLRGCNNCFGCANLKNKSYYFFNEPCSKEEYAAKVAAYDLRSHAVVQDLIRRSQEFWLKYPVKYFHGLRTVNSTGERIFDSKNVRDSYSVRLGENLRYCQDIQYKASNSYDYSVWGVGAENMYECMTCGIGVYNLKFSFCTWEEARNLEYCIYSIGSKDCFGCVGLYKKEYCILNKQYTKEEYFILREKIINHMNEDPYIDTKGRVYRYGEFFPQDLSPVAYNESLAQDHFPLDEVTAKEKGYIWRDLPAREFQKTLLSADLSDNLAEVTDEIIKEIIECFECKKAYRIIPSELSFYRRVGLPLPRLCHDCRFVERFKLMNPPRLYLRACAKCGKGIEASYAPERPEIVYCEECYQQEIV